MKHAIFDVTVHYESNQFMIKAQDSAYEHFNFITNSLSACMTRQYKITRDLAKLQVKALFTYTN